MSPALPIFESKHRSPTAYPLLIHFEAFASDQELPIHIMGWSPLLPLLDPSDHLSVAVLCLPLF
jgi:hypothetical protein